MVIVAQYSPRALPLWDTASISDLPYSISKGQLFCSYKGSWFEWTTSLNSYCQNIITLFSGYVHSPLNLLEQTGDTPPSTPPKLLLCLPKPHLTALCFQCLSVPTNAHYFGICNVSIDLLPNQSFASLLLVHQLLWGRQGEVYEHCLQQLFFHLHKFWKKNLC